MGAGSFSSVYVQNRILNIHLTCCILHSKSKVWAHRLIIPIKAFRIGITRILNRVPVDVTRKSKPQVLRWLL
jgi:hypothetical protein